MATFSMFDDEDYGDLFITQEPSDRVVSLEDSDAYKTVKDPQFSDILDDEKDGMLQRIR